MIIDVIATARPDLLRRLAAHLINTTTGAIVTAADETAGGARRAPPAPCPHRPRTASPATASNAAPPETGRTWKGKPVNDMTHAAIEALQSVWAQLTALVALIVWLVRGEAATKANAASIRQLWKQRAEDQTEAVRQRSEDRESAAESRTHVRAMLSEVQRDVKQLLARRD